MCLRSSCNCFCFFRRDSSTCLFSFTFSLSVSHRVDYQPLLCETLEAESESVELSHAVVAAWSLIRNQAHYRSGSSPLSIEGTQGVTDRRQSKARYPLRLPSAHGL